MTSSPEPLEEIPETRTAHTLFTASVHGHAVMCICSEGTDHAEEEVYLVLPGLDDEDE